MVNWFRFLRPAERCGPLCRSVQDEVASMARAQSIERKYQGISKPGGASSKPSN